MFKPKRPIAPGDRMTVAEFFEFAPADHKAELIDGVLVMPSPALLTHERLQVFLITILSFFVRVHRLGEVLGSRTALDLGVEFHAYEPDILFVRADRLHILHEHGVMGAPDLVVEIMSRGSKTVDRGVKRQVYSQAGVGELWLIDTDGPRGSRFYQRAPTDEMALVDFTGGALRSSVVPGFFLRADWLWPPSGERPDELTVLRELGVLL